MPSSKPSPRSTIYRFEIRLRDIEPPIWNFRLSRAQLKTCEQIIEPVPGHLYWPDLDVDLGLETIRHPERFPLKSRVR
jgi:hypothetical protein